MNRNYLVNMAKKTETEFLFFIDNDLSFPSHSLDRMIAIAEDNKLDILGCNYLFKTLPHQSMAMPKNQGSRQDLCGLDEVDRLPTGFMLIRMSAFDHIESPYFNYVPQGDNVGTEDYPFCDRMREAGIAIWMDLELSLDLIHWGSPMGVKWILEPPGYQYLTDPPDYILPIENR